MKTIAQAFATRPQPDPESFFEFHVNAWGWALIIAAFLLGWLLCRAHRRHREEKARIAGYLDGFQTALLTDQKLAPKATAIKISPIKLPTGRAAQ